MLSFVEELKQYVDEMLIWDGKIRTAKNNLRVKSKQNISEEEKQMLKNMVKGSVCLKIKKYLEVIALVDRYNVFYARDILKALPDYKGQGYCMVLDEYKKEIMEEYIRKNNAMTKSIQHLVDIKKLFEVSTHEEWCELMVKSPYTYADRQDTSDYRVNSCYKLLINTRYSTLFENQIVEPAKLQEYILNGYCILLKDLYTEDNSHVIDKKYIFDMSMDCLGNTIYETMYPNLRNNFWELFNQKTIEKIQREIERKKDTIKEQDDYIKTSKVIIQRQKDDIQDLQNILEDAHEI